MIEDFWATICVPFESYIRGQRVQLPKTRRNAELAASGYLIFDPVIVEYLEPEATYKVRPRRGKSQHQ